MLPVVEPSGLRTARLVVGFSLALVGVSLVPTLIGTAGRLYFWGTLLIGILMLIVAADVCPRTDRAQCQATVESFCSLSSVVAALHPFRRRLKVVRRVMSKIRTIILLLVIPMVCGAERVDPSLIPNMFAPESRPAHSISQLASLVLAITGVMFVLVAGLLIYVIVRYRRRPNDDGMEPAQVYGSGPVEAAWTTVPILIVGVLTLTTARVIHEVQDAREPPSAVDVQVIGHQWWWEMRYPKLGIVTANELHVPISQVGERRPTFLDLRSADVVHSFWVPRLMGKIDLVPNKVNSMWIEPERPGLFLGQCGTYCGTQHANMLIRVYADSPQDFDRWVQQQKKPPENDPSVAAGRRVFERTACINCHVIGSSRRQAIRSRPHALDESQHAGLRRAEQLPCGPARVDQIPRAISNREY